MLNVLDPVAHVTFWPPVVLRAHVPKTAIDENRESSIVSYPNVGVADHFWVHGVPNVVAFKPVVNRALEAVLVQPTLDFGHEFAAGLFRHRIRHVELT
jgi:hypothetical protein